MAYIGNLFREAGAFYIKRSFMEEDLYWAVFQEYVHVLVCKESAPLEFFLEGTRSRTGKSLRPKLGLLGCVCQCCWRQHASDVYLVPINISYSRTLEEEIYAYELLGVPKPKESTSGLFKAKSILSEKYGNIFVHVGAAQCAHQSDLVQTNCSVSTNLEPLSPTEISAVERIGLRLVREQQSLAVVSSFSLAAHYLLQSLTFLDFPLVSYEKLLSHVCSLLECTKRAGHGGAGLLRWEGQGLTDSVDEVLRSSLLLHRNIIDFTDDGKFLKFQLLGFKQGENANTSVENSLDSRVLGLMLQHYANQSVHAFVRPALVWQAAKSLATTGSATTSQEPPTYYVSEHELKTRFMEMLSLFGHDFIFCRNCEEQDFNEGLERLCMYDCVDRKNGVLHLRSPSDPQPVVSTFVTCLKPFMLTYSCAVKVAVTQEWGSEDALVKATQLCIESDLRAMCGPPSAVSLDAIRNSVRALSKCGALRWLRNGSPATLTPSQPQLETVTRLLAEARPAAPTARL